MKLLREESGQVIVFTAMCITVLLGFMALATDIGFLLNDKRQVQTAADCAAVAAAGELKYAGVDGYASTQAAADAAGKASAKQNGFTHGSNGTTVTVHNPPQSGPHQTQTDYAEVILQQSEPTFFMKLFGHQTETVVARAVAGYSGSLGCIYTLATSGTGLAVNGTATLSVPGCNIYDDSTSSTALVTSGSNATLTAKSINIVGHYTGSNITPNPPTTGAASQADPLSYLPAPTVGTCSANPSISSSRTVSAGCYNGLSISGNGTVTLGAGVYYVNGNLSIAGSGTITGTGVTFYVTGTTIVAGGTGLTLTAPTSGTYNGILIFQSRSDTNAMSFSGGASSNIQGIIYAPTTSMLTYTGNGTGNTYLSLVVGAATFAGTSNLKDYALANGNSPLGKISLVE